MQFPYEVNPNPNLRMKNNGLGYVVYWIGNTEKESE